MPEHIKSEPRRTASLNPAAGNGHDRQTTNDRVRLTEIESLVRASPVGKRQTGLFVCFARRGI